MSTVPALFRGLVDDAALFPPGNAPMARAVAEHRHHRVAPYADLVGRFLCPESRLAELAAAAGLDVSDGYAAAVGLPRIGLIADQGLPARSTLTVEAVEIPLTMGEDLNIAIRDIAVHTAGTTAFVEIPRVPGWRGAVEACAAAGLGAKLRTGGLIAGAFPTESETADFIGACVEHGVPFKCTAGLHHAVRHTAPDTGFEHHGFLNILVATAEAGAGGDVAGALAERDGTVLASACAGIDAGPVRDAFVAYGSCSVAEPLTDLIALGLLDPALLAGLPAASKEHA